LIDKYLKWLYEHEDVEESIFAMDSVHTGKGPLRVGYPNESNDIDEDRILIDFDGVIHKYSEGWKDGSIYDEPIEGCREFINKLKNSGYTVIIFTARLSHTNDSDEQESMIKNWLSKYDIKVDGITCQKLPAEIYIDDRGLRFEGKFDELFYKTVISKIQENK
jgi:hypothetical protein